MNLYVEETEFGDPWSGQGAPRNTYAGQTEAAGFFTILQIHREELFEEGFDVDEIDDQSMRELAGGMAEAFSDDFTRVMREVADNLDFPYRGDDDDNEDNENDEFFVETDEE